jgi:hypothetical protein
MMGQLFVKQIDTIKEKKIRKFGNVSNYFRDISQVNQSDSQILSESGIRIAVKSNS